MIEKNHLAFAFSTDELRPPRVDEAFEDQAVALRNVGFSVWTTKPEERKLVTRGEDPVGRIVIYRGWMLDSDGYDNLVASILDAGATPLHSREQYLQCHHIPQWYPLIADSTPETVFLPVNADLEKELRDLNWVGFVIKDFVKSLKTSVGSIIRDPALAPMVATEMRRFRGTIEGGFSIRRLESINPATERRYFVLDGRPWSSDDDVIPKIVYDVASKVSKSRFFSVDVALREDGQARVIELGDGQVSDIVGWTPARFASMWVSAGITTSNCL